MKNKQTLDYYNSHYKHVNLNFDINNYKNMILREHGDLLKDKNKRILEIGCGTGFLLMVLESEGFRNLTGVEIDFNQTRESRKNLKYSKIYNQDIFDFFNKNEEKYDIIFLYDLIEHINKEKIIPLLKLIHNLLNKEGITIIKTPNADSPLFANRMRYIDFTHEISFNKESIEMVLKEAGFSEIDCRGPKILFSYSKILSLPIKFFGNFIFRLYLATYLGKKAFNLILDPNFIILAKK
jgi:2-polyprenyl-3-methyl-5-hydroxy-6-metoxy-1,4-benzoquinol methylase